MFFKWWFLTNSFGFKHNGTHNGLTGIMYLFEDVELVYRSKTLFGVWQIGEDTFRDFLLVDLKVTYFRYLQMFFWMLCAQSPSLCQTFTLLD